jgi:hypothetical protein
MDDSSRLTALLAIYLHKNISSYNRIFMQYVPQWPRVHEMHSVVRWTGSGSHGTSREALGSTRGQARSGAWVKCWITALGNELGLDSERTATQGAGMHRQCRWERNSGSLLGAQH